jgi:hypothetical protein
MRRADERSPYCPTADCLVNREAILEEPVQRVPMAIFNVKLCQDFDQILASMPKLLQRRVYRTTQNILQVCRASVLPNNDIKQERLRFCLYTLRRGIIVLL